MMLLAHSVPNYTFLRHHCDLENVSCERLEHFDHNRDNLILFETFRQWHVICFISVRGKMSFWQFGTFDGTLCSSCKVGPTGLRVPV